MDALRRLQAKRQKIGNEIRSMVSRSASWNSYERARFDRLSNEYDGILRGMEGARHDVQRRAVADRIASDQDRFSFESRTEVGAARLDRRGVYSSQVRSQALQAWFLAPTGRVPNACVQAARRTGISLNLKQLELRYKSRAPRTLAEAYQRAQSVGTATAGGHAVPDEMMGEIEIALLKFGGIRNVATIQRTTTGADLPIPTTNDTSNKGERIDENTTANEQDVTLGQLVLQAYKYSSKMVRVSLELMQDSATDMSTLLGRLLGERVGRIQNEEFTTANGSSKPNGLLNAAADSSVTTASNAALTHSELLQLSHSVDPAYRENGAAQWMFNDTTLRIVKEMKDSQNRPLWLPGVAVGAPDTIDGYGYQINQDMPSGASAKAILFGELSKYIVRDVMEWTLIRLDERYAELGQVAFLGWTRADGDLLDAGTNPVKYLTLAA